MAELDPDHEKGESIQSTGISITHQVPLRNQTVPETVESPREWRVPLTTLQVPSPLIEKGVRQYPLLQGLKSYGMINKFEDEISICPEHSVPLKDGAVNWFIHGTETKAGVIDPLCQKHGLEYEVKLSGERKDQLTAIILYGQVLEKPQIEELVHSACWAFKRALEPRTS